MSHSTTWLVGVIIRMFGDNLSLLRKEKNMEQKALAKVLGVSEQTISRWENNVVEPDIKSLIKIANYFDVTTDYLLGRVDY